MGEQSARILARLLRIWEPPDFIPFFSKTTNRPPHRIKKGTILFNEGDPLERLYLIKEGFVKLYRLSEEGRETTSYLFGPGYVLGLRALTLPDKCARHNAEAITDLEVMTMSHKEYFEAVSSHPEYLLDLMYIFIDRLNYTERKLEGFISTDVTARVANFLADLVSRFCLPRQQAGRKQKNGGAVLPILLTHQRIAELVGSFRETVTIALNKLEKEGIIKTKKGHISVTNLKQLKELASGKKTQ
ncbi:MAG: Crp/Fnr family transcriptional regulator [Candidatus Levybacteria bacterium]|nr:Crp/Fnr family transcriptional regulator [Candidatus Levybacteria bacterium]